MDFIDLVEEYVCSISDADRKYSRFMAAQMLGHVLGKRSYVNINPNTERLNFYVLLIGESYYGRKTVTQDIFKELYPDGAFLPTETSPERFIANLENKPDGVWFNGEFSRILKHMKNGGYLSTVAEVLNDIYKYEGKVYIRQTMKEKFEIEDIYPSFCSTLTPEVLKDNVTEEMMNGGLFGRMLLVDGKSSNGGRKHIDSKTIKIKRYIKDSVQRLYDAKPYIEFKFTDGALKELNAIEDRMAGIEEVRSIAGRYCQAMIKLAAVLCFADEISKDSKKSNKSISSNIDILTMVTYKTKLTNFTKLTNLWITEEHLIKALDMVVPCIEFSKTLKEYVSMNKKHIIKVKHYVRDNYPVSKTKVMQMCNLDAKETREALETLQEMEIIKVVRFQTVKSNGVKSRPKTILCLEKSKKCGDCEHKKWCKRKNGDC